MILYNCRGILHVQQAGLTDWAIWAPKTGSFILTAHHSAAEGYIDFDLNK
jgi:hypothetical protein